MMPDVPLFTRLPWRRMLIPVSVSLVAIAVLSVLVDAGGLLPIFERADPGLLALAALKIPILILLWSLRWYVVIRTRRGPFPFRYMLHAIMIRSFFNNLTPGVSTGGEPFGAWYLSKKTPLTFREAMASTAAERMIQGLIMVFILAVVLSVCVPMAPVSPGQTGMLYLGLGSFFVFVASLFYLSLFHFRYARALIEGLIRLIVRIVPSFRTRWNMDHLREHIDTFHGAYRAYMKSPVAVGSVVTLTVLQAALEAIQPFLLFLALGAAAPFQIVLLNSVLSRIIGIFSLIPGGAGIMESLNVGIYTGLSTIPAQVIIAQTILLRLLDSWLLWGASAITTGVIGISFNASSDTMERNHHETRIVPSGGFSAYRRSAR